ncbi:uncharacterized protein PG986_002148 [Apiospora aurea]|uniref:Clr5 domain-containing protein n=1 Tax=Apiospora aurea TaxID=335848 RepID=A0ABR1QYT6_9PEZI
MPGAAAAMAKPTRCAPELQDLDIWHQYESQLRDLYLVKNQTLKQVKRSMEEQHGWPVSKLTTYEVVLRDELRLVKNLTKDDWHAIHHHMEKRSRDFKRSEVVLYGQPIDQKRVTKAIRRYSRPIDISRVRTPMLRDGIRIRTPPFLSPRTPIPDEMAYIQMPTMAAASNNIANAVSSTLPKGRSTITPIFNRGPLSIQTILDIRANAPFNKFAKMLQDIWIPNIYPVQRNAPAMGDFPQLETGTITGHQFQYTDRVTAHHQSFDIADGSTQPRTGQLESFPGTDEYFGILLKACYVFSNNIDDMEVQRRFLDWVGLIAEMKLLMAFFRLKLPTVVAVWERAIDTLFEIRHGKAFDILIEIGLAVDHGRLLRSRHAMYFAMAIDLGSDKAMGSVSRLLKAGWEDHYWRCCALTQAAKNRDADMLDLLVTAGNCRRGKFDCIVDFLPRASEAMASTTRSLGWPNPGEPELLLDRVLFSDGVDRRVYDAVARKSQWAQNTVTVSGIFLAAERGLIELQQYLDSFPIPEQAIKQVLLQIALSEAADRDAVAVLQCLLQFGVDPNTDKLMSEFVDGEKHPGWRPIDRAIIRWNSSALLLLLNHEANLGNFRSLRDAMHPYVRWESDYAELEKKRGLTIQMILDAGDNIDLLPASLMLAALIPLSPDKLMSTTIEGFCRWTNHIASFEPDYALCDKLQRHGISLNKGVDGCNTIQTVLRKGCCNFASVLYLICNGVQVHSSPRRNDLKNDQGRIGDSTMLHDALIKVPVDRLKIVDLLLENSADIYAVTSKGISSLEASLPSFRLDHPYSNIIEEDRQESLGIFWKLFRPMGPRYVCSLEFQHRSLLSSLVRLGESDENISACLDDLVDLNSYGVSLGHSLLMEAIIWDRTTLAMQLLERGCDVNLRIDSFTPHKQGLYHQCNTAIQAACILGTFQIVTTLLDKGADVNAPPTKHGLTALQIAAAGGRIGIATVLLEKVTDVNAKPGRHFHHATCNKCKRKEVLHAVDFAAGGGHLDMVQLLVDAGGLSANPGVTGLDGAMLGAKEEGHNGILEYTQQHTGHELSEEMCQALGVPSSRASVITGHRVGELELPSTGSECTDGERSCHCQPVVYGIDGQVNGPAEEIPAAQVLSMVPQSHSPTSGPIVHTTGQPGEPHLRLLHTPDADIPGPGPTNADPIVATLYRTATEDPRIRDTTKRGKAEDSSTGELTQFQGSLDQIEANGQK